MSTRSTHIAGTGQSLAPSLAFILVPGPAPAPCVEYFTVGRILQWKEHQCAKKTLSSRPSQGMSVADRFCNGAPWRLLEVLSPVYQPPTPQVKGSRDLLFIWRK